MTSSSNSSFSSPSPAPRKSSSSIPISKRPRRGRAGSGRAASGPLYAGNPSGRGSLGGHVGNVAGYGSAGASLRAEDAHTLSNVAGYGSGSLPGIGGSGKLPFGRKNAAGSATGGGSGMATGPLGSGAAPSPTSRTAPLVSRRGFLIGAGALGAAALIAAGGVYMADEAKRQAEAAVSTLDVPESAVTPMSEMTLLEEPDGLMEQVGTYELPFGTLVWATDDTFAACLVPEDGASPLTSVSLLALGSGDLTTVLSGPVGQAEGFEIFDVRASSNGVIWVECDILDGIWRVYAAPLSLTGMTLGSAVLLDEGESSLWETPTLAVAGTQAFWQVLPQVDGEARTEDSLLKRHSFGSTGWEEAYRSHGRMATPPYSGTDCVCITPRADAGGVYYQLTALDAVTGAQMAAVVLPASMKPLEAAYGPTGFAFSFDAWYSYGDGIADIGTYTPVSRPEGTTEAYSDAQWVRFDRTPTAPPCWCGPYFMVKNKLEVRGMDIAARETFMLDTENGCDTYGDYLATSGARDFVTTYANIDYLPVSGEREKCTRVKVWRALTGQPASEEGSE